MTHPKREEAAGLPMTTPTDEALIAAKTAFEAWWVTNFHECAAQGDVYAIAKFVWLASRPTRAGEGWVTVPREPTEAMIAAGLGALSAWRKTLSADEALLRRSKPVESGRVWLASAEPEEKAIIRYRAMIDAAPPPPSPEGLLAEALDLADDERAGAIKAATKLAGRMGATFVPHEQPAPSPTPPQPQWTDEQVEAMARAHFDSVHEFCGIDDCKDDVTWAAHRGCEMAAMRAALGAVGR